MTRLRFVKEYPNEYYVYNKDGETLGVISYYKTWKKWVWNQWEDMIMSLEENGCMQEVVDFAKNLKVEK